MLEFCVNYYTSVSGFAMDVWKLRGLSNIQLTDIWPSVFGISLSVTLNCLLNFYVCGFIVRYLKAFLVDIKRVKNKHSTLNYFNLVLCFQKLFF